MTINSKFTEIANELRNKYDFDNKLSLDDIYNGINGLFINNYFDDNQTINMTFDNEWISKPINNTLTVDVWNNNIANKVFTMSCDFKWSNYDLDTKYQGDRLFIEICTNNTDGTSSWYGCYYTPTTKNGIKHLRSNFKNVKPISKIVYVLAYDEINPGSNLTVSNMKLFTNPILGGVVRLFLSALLSMRGWAK